MLAFVLLASLELIVQLVCSLTSFLLLLTYFSGEGPFLWPEGQCLHCGQLLGLLQPCQRRCFPWQYRLRDCPSDFELSGLRHLRELRTAAEQVCPD